MAILGLPTLPPPPQGPPRPCCPASPVGRPSPPLSPPHLPLLEVLLQLRLCPLSRETVSVPPFQVESRSRSRSQQATRERLTAPMTSSSGNPGRPASRNRRGCCGHSLGLTCGPTGTLLAGVSMGPQAASVTKQLVRLKLQRDVLAPKQDCKNPGRRTSQPQRRLLSGRKVRVLISGHVV